MGPVMSSRWKQPASRTCASAPNELGDALVADVVRLDPALLLELRCLSLVSSIA